MSSNIDPAIPPFGAATTAGVRNNFNAAKTEIEQLQRQIGYADYNDSLTAGSPIAVGASTWTKLTNNTLGANTRTSALPLGVTSVWNAVSNQLDFTQLPVDTMVDLRADVQLTTTGANQQVRTRLSMQIGGANPFVLGGPTNLFKSAGTYDYTFSIPFYIGSDDTRTNPGEIQIWSDSALSVVVRGWYIRIIKHIPE